MGDDRIDMVIFRIDMGYLVTMRPSTSTLDAPSARPLTTAAPPLPPLPGLHSPLCTELAHTMTATDRSPLLL